MTNLLAILDAAMEELGETRPPTAASPRDADAAGADPETPNILKFRGDPVLPVVPAAKSNHLDGTQLSDGDTACGPDQCGEGASNKYPSQRTGSTGTAGTGEVSSRAPGSRDRPVVANDGSVTGSASAVPLPPDEIGYLTDHRLVIDFETRSTLNLKGCGSHVYAEHPSTEVWVACYAIGRGPVRTWYPGDPVPADLAEHVRAGLPLIAHNAAFERAIWRNIMVPRHDWPVTTLEQWHCTLAMAAAMALPHSLEEAARITGCSFQKDLEGRRLMVQMSRALPAVEGDCPFCGAKPDEPPPPACTCDDGQDWRKRLRWKDDALSVRRGTEYCIRDVETERELLSKLKPLSQFERKIWLLDQRINERGISVDERAVHNAIDIAEKRLGDLTEELRELTGGAVDAPTQLQRLIEWLRNQGVDLAGDKLDKEQIAALLRRDNLSAACRRALEIRLETANPSLGKLRAYRDRASADGRLRGTLMYCGASRTARWAGIGAQVQNIPRGGMAFATDAVESISEGLSVDTLEFLFGPPFDVITNCLRPMLMAAPSFDLLCADYNAIEARGTAWLAEADRMLGIFRRGDDPYCDMAARIYGRPADSFGRTSRERQLGKIAVLGLGYQMGAQRFQRTCARQGVMILAEEAENIKGIYRQSNPEIVRLWDRMNKAAVRAVTDPSRWICVANGRIGFLKEDSSLYLRLPSGRLLTYANPRYEMVEKPFGTGWGLTFEGVNNITRRWERQTLYGGKLTENAVQAICRDLLAEALLRLEAEGYPVILHVHDEIVAEVPEGAGDLAEFEQLMAQVPVWARGFPVKAEGWRGQRFGK